jgi:hypothetical protein
LADILFFLIGSCLIKKKFKDSTVLKKDTKID